MNNTVKAALIFTAGAVIGSVGTWYIVKTKYEKIANEEIESVKATFSKREVKPEPEKSPDEKIEETIQEEDHTEDYEKVLEKFGYKNYSKNPHREDGKDYDLPSEDDNPFVSFINDDEYGFEFEAESLDYFAGDNKVVNELGEILSEDEINDAIGVDWKDKFENCGYEKLYIRNSYQEKDYEVVLSAGKWQEDSEEE